MVRSAAGLADYTIVTIHAHEGGRDRLLPADFLVTFARAMVDAGADMFVGHGPHVLRGIEIYKGKPILYSLGDFIFQNETLMRLPSENYETYDLARTSTSTISTTRATTSTRAASLPIADLGGRGRGAEVPRQAVDRTRACTRSRSASGRRGACVAGRSLPKASSVRKFWEI